MINLKKGDTKMNEFEKKFKPATGKQLSRLADLYGLKRKTFFRIPLESDKKLRKRITSEINKRSYIS